MASNNLSRLGAGLILLICVLFAPWFITGTLMLLFSFAFPRYYEVLVAGVGIDLLYNIPHGATFWTGWEATLIALILFLTTPYIRRRIIELTL